MRQLSLLVCAAALAAPAVQAATPGEIGTTVAVVNLVTAELSTERRNLATGDGVRQNEVIEAAPQARSEFRLADDTKLALGPGARLVLDKFVYDPDKKAGNIAVDLAKGAFRFMTGVASKPSYVVRVPNASITVRGTIFDVFVQDSGAAWLLLHEGGVKVCNDRGSCRVLDEPGKLILVNDEGDVGKPFRWASLKGVQGFSFDTAFPFVGEAPSIDPKPIFTKDALLEDAPAPKTKPKRERKADAGEKASADDGASDQPATTVTKPKKPIRIVKPRKPGLSIAEETVPERVDVKPPRVKKPKTEEVDSGNGKGPTRVVVKPPRIKKPKLDTADQAEDGRKWRRIAETTASQWINRVRNRGGDHADPVGQSVPRVNFNRPVMKVPSMGGMGKPAGPSQLR